MKFYQIGFRATALRQRLNFWHAPGYNDPRPVTLSPVTPRLFQARAFCINYNIASGIGYSSKKLQHN